MRRKTLKITKVWYLVDGHMLGRLRKYGCLCGALPPGQQCVHCGLIEQVKGGKAGPVVREDQT